MDEIRGIRKKFDDAGIDLYAFNYSFRDEFTDEQIEQGFLMAKAMGVTRITASANVDISPRVDKYARAIQDLCRLSRSRQHEAERVFHSGRLEAARWPAVRSTPASISTSATSPPPASIRSSFFEEHHAKIITLHIKDRKKNHGPNMPLGEGDTNIKGVLEVLKTKKYPIPAMIEYEYGKPGMDTVAEVKKCFDYCKAALA